MPTPFRNSPGLLVRVAIAAAIVLSPLAASAQSVTLDQFRASPLATDGFALSRPDDLGHRRFAAQLTLDYALNPLVYETTPGNPDTELAAIVEHQAVAHLSLAFGIADRLIVSLGLPVSVYQSGAEVAGIATADDASVGDAQLLLRVRLVGERDDTFALAVQLTGTAPLAAALNENQHYSGEPDLTVTPALLAELRGGPVRVTANLGARFRETARVPTLALRNELMYALGMTVALVRRPTHDMLDLHAELYGVSSLRDFGGQTLSPLEGILGLKLSPSCSFHVGLAGGAGLLRGYGSPDFRGVLTLGYADACAEPVAAPPPPAAVPVDDDRDHDGIANPRDVCPDAAEDLDQHEDTDGCPETDNDRDRVPDAHDAAPNVPEDADDFEDWDGIPEPDNDHDGLLDAADRCPIVPEDRDGVADGDGCPEEDADGDHVPDGADRCPLTPGVHSAAHPECEGCPALACMTAEGTITILERVEFATGSDRILPASEPVLQAVQQILATNPQIHRLRVEGHTDDVGDDARNLALSQGRAESVMRWLSAHGVEAARLEAQGFGETRPLASNRRSRNRQLNRRVEFHITDPAPPSATTTTATPTSATPPSATPTTALPTTAPTAPAPLTATPSAAPASPTPPVTPPPTPGADLIPWKP